MTTDTLQTQWQSLVDRGQFDQLQAAAERMVPRGALVAIRMGWVKTDLLGEWGLWGNAVLQALKASEVELAKLHKYCNSLEADNRALHELREECERKDARITLLEQQAEELKAEADNISGRLAFEMGQVEKKAKYIAELEAELDGQVAHA